eukprot:m.344546 g.344546  ORF g.344546 m.344546 type:complete len:301 (+) comp20645_c0_seq18:367-1269(+)
MGAKAITALALIACAVTTHIAHRNRATRIHEKTHHDRHIPWVPLRIPHMPAEPVCTPDPANTVGLSPTKIPRRIIQTWKSVSPKGKWKEWSETIQRLHPTFEYLLFDDDAIERFLSAQYPAILPVYRTIPSPRRAQRYDLFRMLAVQHYGGIYFDMDVVLREPVDDILNASAVFPHEEIIHSQICRQHQQFGRWAEMDCSVEFPQIGQFGFAAEANHKFLAVLVDGMVREFSQPSVHIRYADVYTFTTSGPDYVSRQYERHPELHDNITILHADEASGVEDKFQFGRFGHHEMEGSWRGP